ncbi:cobyrinate a,c-diamide synthase [Paludifilum halophilum]|uniref:Cobyrinate a,c-diamide synthase n=1 Tax=Paludifilum halophilum TaxID=1642702 RepID=A0A235B977_9BACL|nr:cobyrinate a,c-diamide synthase [Paludifilum halophilum]OYD08811.1 cobyrinic acid a,c-diamide synthase [Paludifilum halophilum]
MRRPRVVIAGTESGVGKTTVTLGLMAALKQRGLKVQGFKAGPDYIDPGYHTAVTGRSSRNLDTWMMSGDTMREIFLRGGEGADISVVEGVMGLFDGQDPRSDRGSTAEIAVRLDCPVLLIVDVRSMARSAAAVVLGYQSLNPSVRVAGVIANRAGGEGHYRLVKEAIEQECGVPVLGWLERDEKLEMEERHLGLIPALERGACDELFRHAAEAVEKGVDLKTVLAQAQKASPLSLPERQMFASHGDRPHASPRIAVARDAAFHFYYPENLELLEQFGATLLEFSPLAGEPVPEEADGLYIGGGFPEEFVDDLSCQERVRRDLRSRIQQGLPTYAECGGFMFLCQRIIDRKGKSHPMAGVIPATVRMTDRLAALGYREVTALRDTLLLTKGEKARGHEFHYSVLAEGPPGVPAYEEKSRFGRGETGFVQGNLLAGYTHLHFASNPRMVERWLSHVKKTTRNIDKNMNHR